MTTSDDLADAIVEHFNSVEEPIIAFLAQNPAEVPEVLAESDDYVVFVFPDSESETAFDRADACDERLTVGVVVNGPIRGNNTRAVALQFTKQLRRSLRETDFEFDGERFHWVSNEVDPLFDVEAMKTKGQFLSAFRATYQGLT